MAVVSPALSCGVVRCFVSGGEATAEAAGPGEDAGAKQLRGLDAAQAAARPGHPAQRA